MTFKSRPQVLITVKMGPDGQLSLQETVSLDYTWSEFGEHSSCLVVSNLPHIYACSKPQRIGPRDSSVGVSFVFGASTLRRDCILVDVSDSN